MAVQELKRKGGRVHGRRQRGGQRHRARVRSRHLPARRTRGRGRLHQGVHQHGGQLRDARAAPRPGARPVGHPRRAHRGWPAGAAVPGGRDPRRRAGDRRDRAPVRRGGQHVLHRPGRRLAGGAGGRAEAQGDLLRARRGLPGRRAEARPARADPARHAEHGDRPVRRTDRQEHLHHRADQGTRRPGHRADERRHPRRAGRRDDQGAAGRAGARSRSCSTSRCRYSPTTPRGSSAGTSTSPATWPRASRSSNPGHSGARSRSG